MLGVVLQSGELQSEEAINLRGPRVHGRRDIAGDGMSSRTIEPAIEMNFISIPY